MPREYRGVKAKQPLGDGISVVGKVQVASAGSDAPGPVWRATAPALVSVREFLRLQSAAPRMSFFARLCGSDPLARSAAHAYAGARAEVEVSDCLDGLGDEWTIIDGASLGAHKPVVDHVVIGPAGVFSVALRNHTRDRVWVGERTFVVEGTRFPHLRDVEHEAELVGDRMSRAVGAPVAVTPCLVIASPAELTLAPGARRVEVLASHQLGRWLTALPRLMSPAVVERHRESALAGATWFAGAGEWDDSAEIRASFDSVHSRIVRARRIRLGWAIAGVMLSQLVLVASAFGVSPVLEALGL